jgi:two-component system, NtrC family, sensor kinase
MSENSEIEILLSMQPYSTMKNIFAVFLLFSLNAFAQKQAIFRIDSLPKQGILLDKGWKWHAGDNPDFAKADFDDSAWENIDPMKDIYDLPQIRKSSVGWFRIRFYVDSSLLNKPLTFQVYQTLASEIYLNGRLLKKYGIVSSKKDEIRGFLPQNFPISTLFKNQEQVISVRFSVQPNLPYFKYVYPYLVFALCLNTIEGAAQIQVDSFSNSHMRGFNTGMFLLLGLVHVIFYLNFRRQRAYLYFAIALFSIGIGYMLTPFLLTETSITVKAYVAVISYPLLFSFYGFFLYLAVWEMFFRRKNIMFWLLLSSTIIGPIVNVFFYKSGYLFLTSSMLLCSLETARIAYITYQTNRKVAVILFGQITYFISFMLFLLMLLKIIPNTTLTSYWFVPNSWTLQDLTHWFSLVTIPFTLSWYLSKEFAFTSKELEKKLEEVQQLSAEKQHILSTQNETLEKQVKERTAELVASQNQLIQKEKLASLGELTAGIAHEIQNPLNFVNNFSELSVELIQELSDEIKAPIGGLGAELLSDITQNLEKINHHGKRASSIVKGMLEHSRASTGVKELTDINALADEYLRLSYHGLRAKDKDFNANFKTDFDENVPKIAVIPQDFGRVLLNLINNAFYAVKAPQPPMGALYSPKVTVSTEYIAPPSGAAVIRITDNGTGMSEATKAKIFQPFFTTKPTGQGTGLGLSLAYDIITKGHGGTIEVETKEGEGTTFIIKLPINN